MQGYYRNIEDQMHIFLYGNWMVKMVKINDHEQDMKLEYNGNNAYEVLQIMLLNLSPTRSRGLANSWSLPR